MTDVLEYPHSMENGMMYIIDKILDRLTELNQTGEDHIYFSGEFDSNQTEFEELSNKLKLGVVAKSDLVGRALLRLVRMIIDKHPNLLSYDIGSVLEELETLTLTGLIEYIAEEESNYGEKFGVNDTFTTTLYGRGSEITIKKTLSGVNDVWTLERVKKEIGSLF